LTIQQVFGHALTKIRKPPEKRRVLDGTRPDEIVSIAVFEIVSIHAVEIVLALLWACEDVPSVIAPIDESTTFCSGPVYSVPDVHVVELVLIRFGVRPIEGPPLSAIDRTAPTKILPWP